MSLPTLPTLPTLFDVCSPRADVQAGQITESDFAADLARVIRGDAPPAYQEAPQFFANTHPTRGLRELLASVGQRLQGSSQQVGAIFRLDTNYGGGKTHALIALWHVINGLPGVDNIAEFIDPALVPRGRVRVAAFDGENADPVNGRWLADGVLAKTPWGEIAWSLAGREGYERVRSSDEQGIAPGAETMRALFGQEPTLILLDELSIYLRKLKGRVHDRGGQLTAFLTALFKAVESSPNAALVYTLAIGKGGVATDAYAEENQAIAAAIDHLMNELMSVSARKATLLDPTEEDETVKVLRRRLFAWIDDDRAQAIIAAYRQVWDQHHEGIRYSGDAAARFEAFQQGFPLHPELIETLRDKTATLSNFQRVRGMLRLLARTVAQLWEQQPRPTYAIHLHHLGPEQEAIRREIVTRLGQSQFLPAIRADVAGVEGDQPALAQVLDKRQYPGLPPYGSLVARVILWHSLAFNEALKGLTVEQLRYSVLAPGLDVSFVDDAVRRFVQESAYLDDRPQAPLRFLAEANLTQLIRRQEQQVDPGRLRDELNDHIRQLFKTGNVFQLVPFPGGPYDIPDDTGEGKPYLVLVGYEAEAVDSLRVTVPALVQRLFVEKGSSGDTRLNRNNLVFLCVDRDRREKMRQMMVRQMAIRDLLRSPTFAQLADYQQAQLQEMAGKSQSQAAIAVQEAYRHLFYPSRHRVEGCEVDLAHAVVDLPSAAESPGAGQKQVVRLLRESGKLRLPEDNPDGPTYIRDKTPLRKGQISTAALRLEFYRDPGLPMLIGDQVFIKGIMQGIGAGVFVYQCGELFWGQGNPPAQIKVEENAYVLTMAYAQEREIWPPPLKLTPPPGKYVEPGGGTVLTAGERPTGADFGTAGRDLPDGLPGVTSIPAGSVSQIAPPTQFAAEGPLREALTRVWEQARSAQVVRLAALNIQIFDPSDAFTLLGYVRQIPNTRVTVQLEGEYGTVAESLFTFTFAGEMNDAGPVKDFLAAQMRAAPVKSLDATYAIAFLDGLDLAGDEPEQMTERLCRMGAGAAHVSATAAEGMTDGR